MTTVAAGSRDREPSITQDAGEEMHHCGFCGTRTSYVSTTNDDAVQHFHRCPHCLQHYHLEEPKEVDLDDDAADPVVTGDLGDIEVIDETGKVIGTTAVPGMDLSNLDKLLRTMMDPQAPTTAAEHKINDLFVERNVAYGDKFGSF